MSMTSPGRRARSTAVRHVLATCAVAAVVCVVAAALGRDDNIPLILLAAPVLGLLSAAARTWARRSDGE
ncbi:MULTISPECIES: hypothetical protein [unclassified Actinomyces]|nr:MULTISPECIES: hypothetical protein [unclassified Actinomyces]MCL3778081.1 hypothetical protein [Actinomyces sp. AC-20-1]MCL3790484.1 hypothetical protein [Actinomyces sp. 187325]MCL3795252.1 hypothetical protein [Actinomyces sp. 217892]